MEKNTIISFKNVKKYYGNKLILKDLNMEINKGEFITVLGASGSGKTTMLRLINGLISADSGEVRVKGKNVKESNLIDLRHKIGYVIQGVGLFPHLNIEKNIKFPIEIRKDKEKIELKDEKIKKELKDILKMLDVEEEVLSRYPSQLSGGQKQRIGIARSLITNPEILLMDEPFGAVDEITRKVLQDEIINIQKKFNTTIFFITHDVREAFKLGQRIIIMNKGEIIQFGTKDEILRNPKNDFVKNILGDNI